MTDKANTTPEETPVHLDENSIFQNFLNLLYRRGYKQRLQALVKSQSMTCSEISVNERPVKLVTKNIRIN